MPKAIWNGQVLAQSNNTVVVEGNHYFPPDSIQAEFFRDSQTSSTCPWKGKASYKTIEVAGQSNKDAAWYYPEPSQAARAIKGYLAFWKGIRIED
jgi:uncharacterized protein (DUF427 family)